MRAFLSLDSNFGPAVSANGDRSKSGIGSARYLLAGYRGLWRSPFPPQDEGGAKLPRQNLLVNGVATQIYEGYQSAFVFPLLELQGEDFSTFEP
jgi:hypothetical protein